MVPENLFRLIACVHSEPRVRNQQADSSRRHLDTIISSRGFGNRRLREQQGSNDETRNQELRHAHDSLWHTTPPLAGAATSHRGLGGRGFCERHDAHVVTTAAPPPRGDSAPCSPACRSVLRGCPRRGQPPRYAPNRSPAR